ncbi:transmembrane emp24 domain-containing protein [Plakobranchus ocellatus]|uniref:Transmembrane emp24 domain-containing protein n=1 Tax=Plakobranchus ocellatus TaxID=259542 RepID=A0AAV4AH18_9GAST|nr:transmembrane emp24 domain-containing protein [Plakobranchus ocellatus]
MHGPKKHGFHSTDSQCLIRSETDYRIHFCSPNFNNKLGGQVFNSANRINSKNFRKSQLVPGSATCTVIVCLLLLLLELPSFVRSEDVLGVKDDEFDFDGLPGAQHDFKVYVHAGMEECFFQRVAQGAEFYARFEVLKGVERDVDFYLRGRSGEVLQHKTGTDGFLHQKAMNEGVYAVCIDNVFDRYGYKVVYVYIVTLVMQDWLKYQEELQKIELMAKNFSVSLSTVETSINEMKQSQSKARFNVVRDWYRVTSNLYYVGMWSIMQCGLIIFASVAQVYSLRRLFRTTTTTPTTSKPRA